LKTEKARSAWRRAVKWTTLAIGVVFITALAGLVSLYFALRSPEFYERLTPELTPYLQRWGIELEQLGFAQIDLLRFITIQDVHIRWHDTDLGDLDFVAGTFNFEYSFPSLFTDGLKVDHIILNDVAITARLLPRVTPPIPTAPEPLNWEELGQRLSAPPLPVRVQQLTLKALRFDVRLDEGRQQRHLQGELHHMGGEITWQPDLLQGQFRLNIGQNGKDAWHLSQGDQNEALELDLIPKLNADLAWDIALREGGWQVRKATFKNQAAVLQATLNRLHENEKQRVGTLDSFKYVLSSTAKSVSARPQGEGLATLFPLATQMELQAVTSGLVVEGFSQDGLRLDAHADHRLQLTLNGPLQPFEFLPGQMHYQTDQTLAFEHFNAQYEGQNVALKDFNLDLSARGDAPTDTQAVAPLTFDLNLDSQARQLRLNQQPATAMETEVETAFSPALRLQASGKLQLVRDSLQILRAQFQPELSVEQFVLRQGQGTQKQQYRFERQWLMAQGHYEDGHLNLAGDLDLHHITVPEVAKVFSMNNHWQLVTDRGLLHPELSVQVALDHMPLAQLRVQADNRPETLSVQHDVQLDFSSQLASYHPAAEVLQKTGDIEIQWPGQLQVHHGAKDLQSADVSRFAQWPLQGKGNIKINQKERPPGAQGLVLQAPTKISYVVSKAQDYQTEIRFETPGIKMPPLQQPLPFQLHHQARFTWPLSRVQTTGELNIGGTEAAQYRFIVNNNPQRLSVDSSLSLKTDPAWQRYLPQLKPLQAIGQMQALVNIKGELTHPYPSFVQFSPEQLSNIQSRITLDTTISQSSRHAGTPLRLAEPARLHQNLEWSTKRLRWKGRFNVAAAEAMGGVAVKSLTGDFRVNAASGMHPRDIQLGLHVDKGHVQLLKAAKKDVPLDLSTLMPLDLQLAATEKDGHVRLGNLRLQTAAELFTIQSSGEATLDAKDVQLEGLLTTRLRPNMLNEPPLSGTGSVAIPWHLTMIDGNQISVDGEVRFTDLDVTSDQFKLQGLNGTVKLQEEMLRVGEQLKFRYLVDIDPFQRVHFSRIEPYLNGPHTLQFERVTTRDKTLGPGSASVLLKQNVLRLQQLDLDLFGGHLTGELYLDVRPGAWKMGLLSRVSQLDPRKLLPPTATRAQTAYAPINARTAITFDVTQRLLEGRIDITQISREQLFQLLEIVDPDYQDEQLARIRTALRIAYPQRVSVDMEQGLMNLEVAISALPKPLRVRGLPLSPLIRHFGGEVLQKLEQVPLK
jgi:hypothetical protein